MGGKRRDPGADKGICWNGERGCGPWAIWYDDVVKVAGIRTNAPSTPEANYRRGRRLNAQMDRLNPYPRPRGFVHKARSWDEYEQWRRKQPNHRLW